MYIFLAFIYGTALGSFAHVVADRLRVKNIWIDRSQCLSCGVKLTWHDIVPLISYFALKGKCRHCGSKFSQSYVWSEIVSGALTAVLAMTVMSMAISPAMQIGVFVFWSIVIALSMAILIYDLRHTIVPLEAVLILLGMGLVATVIRQYAYGFNVYDFFSGAIIALPFALLHIFSKGRWVGMGDVFVYGAFGFLLGLPLGISMFFYSVWLGTFVSFLLLILYRKEYGMKTEIPFTPFIIIAAFLVLCANIDILNLHEILR